MANKKFDTQIPIMFMVNQEKLKQYTVHRTHNIDWFNFITVENGKKNFDTQIPIMFMVNQEKLKKYTVHRTENIDWFFGE